MKTVFVALFTILVLSSCTPNLREELDESLRNYNNLFRWQALDSASMFVADSVRENFVTRMQAAKKVKIIDYRIVSIQYDEKKRKARVEVDIEYYLLSTAQVRNLRDIEEWAYKEESGTKGWRLMSPFPEFK